MNPPQKLWAPRFFVVLSVACCGGLLYWLWPDRQYYLMSTAARLSHPRHDFLRSSGLGGLSFGAVATLLIFANLGYLVRKELIRVNWLGSLRSWMSFHVFTGLLAGVFVLLHSTFVWRSNLGVLASTGMAIVVVTGLIGRYIYAHTPRSIEGHELELEEIRRRLADYRSTLQNLGVPTDFFERTLVSPGALPSHGVLASLLGMVTGDRLLRRQFLALRETILKLPSLNRWAGEILPLAERYCKESLWVERYGELRGLMSGWRFMHRWFAVILISAVVFHMYVAAQMGDLWLFHPFQKSMSSLPEPVSIAAPEPLQSVKPLTPLMRAAPPRRHHKGRKRRS